MFLTAPIYRSWHLRWGATPAETVEQLPGDEFLPVAQFRSTRAITIDAPPEAVWPWLVQVGCLRGGFYSDDLLDNLGHPSATTIVPALQHLEIGQWVPMSPAETPTDRTALRVHSFAVNEWLLWTKPDSTWVWRMTPTENGGTRLVSRIHAVYDWRHPLMAVLGVLLMEFGDFAMMRRMLRGIKARAESLAVGGADTALPSRRNGTDLGLLVGAATVLFTALYFVSDLIEVAQGDFSMTRLGLTVAGEAAIPIFVIGLYAVQRPRIGRLGLVGALAFAYSYVFFTTTVMYALIAGTANYAALTKIFGAWMTVHGFVMVIGGLAFGLAVTRAGVLPRWTGVCLMVGVLLVAAASGFPNVARTAAAAVPAAAFIGMGLSLLRRPHGRRVSGRE